MPFFSNKLIFYFNFKIINFSFTCLNNSIVSVVVNTTKNICTKELLKKNFPSHD